MTFGLEEQDDQHRDYSRVYSEGTGKSDYDKRYVTGGGSESHMQGLNKLKYNKMTNLTYRVGSLIRDSLVPCDDRGNCVKTSRIS